ncbi:DUF6129 family protein [Immundisolibacter cernigliae]|uniref:DUF6129 domain-containing protein n=1 Tax=Immundisolibacter cernigliae TaxID=1810504 RepID=A0A1B1YPQ5_9GAMM|nr:DUF6129 family protein [Immundisolibacter cernigliae]ANX02770.1 hypothetical protein PG2T_00190 [Immundisolibacter cernigliae]
MESVDLEALDALLAAAGGQDGAALRARFPRLTVTRCDAADLAESPYRSYPGFDLHLVDGAGHCWQITADPAQATGIVLARRAP